MPSSSPYPPRQSQVALDSRSKSLFRLANSADDGSESAGVYARAHGLALAASLRGCGFGPDVAGGWAEASVHPRIDALVAEVGLETLAILLAERFAAE